MAMAQNAGLQCFACEWRPIFEPFASSSAHLEIGGCHCEQNLLPVRTLKRWTSILWIAVLAFWLPGSMHCSLEAAGILSSDCCSSSASNHPDSESRKCADHCEVCSAVESGGYSKPDTCIDVTPVLCLLSLAILEFQIPEAPLDATYLGTSPPPEILPLWRFVERVALSPRAPSLVS